MLKIRRSQDSLIFNIFPWLCVWDICYIIICHLLYIHSIKTGNLFSLVLCSLWWVPIVGYVLACRSYLFVCTLHHLIIIIVQTLTEDIELVKCLLDIICRVCELDYVNSPSYPLYNMLGCVFSVYPFPLWWLREWMYIHTLSYYHHQIGSMNYYPLFRIGSWNNGTRCMSFYILMGIPILVRQHFHIQTPPGIKCDN